MMFVVSVARPALKKSANWLLAGYLLFLLANVMSPLIKPVNFQQLCSANGVVRMVAVLDDGTVSEPHHSVECPLCLMAGAPPALWVSWSPSYYPLAYFAAGTPAARIAALTGAPLPPRGPPAFS